MTAQRNHYEVLGVSPTANTDQIKTKYREMARMFHPDVAKDKALAQKMFTQINQAYRVLADPERRAQYDAGLRAAVAPRVTPTAPHVPPASPPNAPPSASSAPRPAPTTSPSTASATRPTPTNGARPAGAALEGPQALAVARLANDADFALMNGDAASALVHAQEALRLDARHAKALGLLGDAMAALGRREEAAAAYRRSLQETASPMIQAKLDRLGATAARTNTTLGASGDSVRPATVPLAPAASSGSLLSRLWGKKK